MVIIVLKINTIPGGVVDREATNEALWKSSQGLMLECEHCGRRFKVTSAIVALSADTLRCLVL